LRPVWPRTPRTVRRQWRWWESRGRHRRRTR
jgi:hypothetical protein